jgi:hypothetical protein
MHLKNLKDGKETIRKKFIDKFVHEHEFKNLKQDIYSRNSVIYWNNNTSRLISFCFRNGNLVKYSNINYHKKSNMYTNKQIEENSHSQLNRNRKDSIRLNTHMIKIIMKLTVKGNLLISFF